MAVMHPENLSNYNATFSERKIYDAFKEQLPPNFHVFYSVRWYVTTSEGKREDSECDFLIFDPGFGFLTIEVKGGLSIDIENGNWILTEKDEKGDIQTRMLKKSPFRQAEDSMRYFYDYFSDEFIQSFKGVYGFAVCFPMYKINEKVESAADKNLIIDISDFSNLKKKINDIFHYWKLKLNTRAPFSADQKQKFITLVNKRISLSAAAGALIPIKEKEIEKINLVQDSIIDFLTNYKQVQIIGGAGTGKTFMGIKKIARLNYNNNQILYVCKNAKLASFVKQYFSKDDNVHCYDFRDLMLNKYGINLSSNETYFDKIGKKNISKYDAIIVDEGQDFNTDEALSIKMLLLDEVNSWMYVFFDENQNLFNTQFDTTFDIDERPYILRYNIRNTGAIYDYATENSGLGKDTIANNLLGVKPENIICKNSIQVVSSISRILNRLIQKEMVKNSSIVILSNVECNKSMLFNEASVGEYKIVYDINKVDENSILFQSVSDFKGLESDVIIYLKDKSGESISPEVKKRIDYVAYTRARYYLYVINCN